MYKTIIIGKNSNLSQSLANQLGAADILSSRDILHNVKCLSFLKGEAVSIIFNNFQPSTKLNDLSRPENYVINSIGITSKVLNYCKQNEILVNKIIYTSSSSVYGNNILCSENDELRPMNLHASLKISNEKLIEKFCIDNDIDYTIARVFNMYGGKDNFSIVSKILKTYKLNNELTIVNNGNAIRDFIHIDDVVDIYKELLNIKDIKILNIGTGTGTSIKNILDFFYNHKLDLKTQTIFRDELKTSTSDNRLLMNIINKKDFIQVENYLKEELKI